LSSKRKHDLLEKQGIIIIIGPVVNAAENLTFRNSYQSVESTTGLYSEREMLGEKSRVKQEEKTKYKNVPLGGTMGYLEHVTRMAISESWLPSNSIKSCLVPAFH
jgi:hypothetical protein